MAYSEKVIDHYNDPKNVGSFVKEEDGVGTGLVGAPECGDQGRGQFGGGGWSRGRGATWQPDCAARALWALVSVVCAVLCAPHSAPHAQNVWN